MKEDFAMKRNLIVPGLVALLGAAPVLSGPAAAQVSVSVSVGVVAPPVYGHVVIGEPRYRVYRPHPRYYHRPSYRPYYRRYYRPAVVVVVPRGHGHRGHRRHHGRDD